MRTTTNNQPRIEELELQLKQSRRLNESLEKLNNYLGERNEVKERQLSVLRDINENCISGMLQSFDLLERLINSEASMFDLVNRMIEEEEERRKELIAACASGHK